MKLTAVLLCIAATGTLFGGDLYTSTSGDISLTAMAWSNTFVPTAVSEWRPVTVTGTWITACTSSQTTARLRAVITYKTGADTSRTVEDFTPLMAAGNGLRCGSALPIIAKDKIISISVVTASSDFTDITPK